MSRMTRRDVLTTAVKAGVAATALPYLVLDGASACDGAQHLVTGGGNVIPPPDSLPRREVGLHWLRCSFNISHLPVAESYLSQVFGLSEADEYGLWSYTNRYRWSNGVSLSYDLDAERSERVHKSRVTLDCPGKSLDELSAGQTLELIDFLKHIGSKCSRIDIFFDDYERIVSPKDLQPIIERHDYSGFKRAAFTRSYKGESLDYDIAMFGGRGSSGNGKYLRCYDKFLESKGQMDCIRWEVEFSQTRANNVFIRLSQAVKNVDAFALLCGSLVAGCITFVKRTGDKNVKRLKRYEWWQRILNILGNGVTVRVERKPESVRGKLVWVRRGVGPSLACLRKIFDTENNFFDWLRFICSEGESNMNNFAVELAADYAETLRFHKSSHRFSFRTYNGAQEYDADLS